MVKSFCVIFILISSLTSYSKDFSKNSTEQFKLDTAGIELSLPSNWRLSHKLPNSMIKKLGYKYVFEQKNPNQTNKIIGVRVDYNGSNSDYCPKNSNAFKKAQSSLICVYSDQNNNYATFKLATKIRTPASKAKLNFIRFVTIVEINNSKNESFDKIVNSVKELK